MKLIVMLFQNHQNVIHSKTTWLRVERCNKWWNKGGSRIVYPYGCCKETSDKVLLVYKSYVSNTILFRIIAEGPFLANLVQYAICE